MSISKKASGLNGRARQFVLAGGLVLTAVAAPIGVAVAVQGGGVVTHSVASCPDGEVLDPNSGVCRPVVEDVTAPPPDLIAPTPNPIDPNSAPLQPNSITSSENGETGRLQEINGVPCDGTNTGQCIGLAENQPTHHQQPHSTVSSSP